MNPSMPDDEQLASFFREHLERKFEESPTLATALGDSRYDDRLDDVSREARARRVKAAREALEHLETRFTDEALSPDGRVDVAILRNSLERELWSAEHLRPFETDPRTYGQLVSDSVYRLITKSTAPEEERIDRAVRRIEQIPEVLAEARRSLERPAAPVLETAIRQNRGALSFYERDLFLHLKGSGDVDRLRSAADDLLDPLREHQRFLEGELRDRATPEWRLGAERYEEKFELENFAGVRLSEHLAEAEAELGRVLDDQHLVARQLWSRCFPGQSPPPDDVEGRRERIEGVNRALSADHGTAEALVTDARTTVEEIRAFIRKRGLLELPDPDRCEVIEMPAFRRGNSFAYLDPAPPLAPEAPSYYAVSPPPEEWSESERRGFLEEYNTHMLRILTIHEAYPGHYVQLAHANRNPSLIRRVLGSGSFIEGWAVCGEATMLDEGYGDLRLRFMQLKFYLRAIVNAILDHRMHCGNMSDEEAMTLLTRQGFQTAGEARLKVIRAKQSSVQLSTYFVGRMAHYRLQQQIKREQGNAFDLGRYHRAVLEIGSVPPVFMGDLVRRRLA